MGGRLARRQLDWRWLMVGAAALGGSAEATPELFRAADGAVIEAAAAPAAAPLLLRLDGGDRIELLGHRIASTHGAQLYVVVSSDYAKWAIVAGSADVDRASFAAGEVALTPIGGGPTLRRRFDAHRLLAAAPPGIAPALGSALAPVVARQRRERFFGTLAAAPAPRAPGLAALEAVRRGYLSDPVVLALRSDNPDPAARRRATADRFAAALAAGNGATVAALLDPTPFLAAGPGWAASRRSFADDLVGRLGGGPVAAPDPDADGYRVTLRDRGYRLVLAAHEGVPFVAALEPLA